MGGEGGEDGEKLIKDSHVGRGNGWREVKVRSNDKARLLSLYSCVGLGDK